MSGKQPEALRLADCLERDFGMNWPDFDNGMSAAAELRRLYARNAELELAVLAERERCAMACEEMSGAHAYGPAWNSQKSLTAQECADAIRAGA